MQTISPELDATVKQEHTIHVKPRVVAEWDYNRYAVTVNAYNDSATQPNRFAADDFQIASIIRMNRPKAGITKAFVGQSWISRNSSDHRYRIVGSVDDTYEYWVSPRMSSATPLGGTTSEYAISGVRPTVEYDKGYFANKLVVKIEDSWGVGEDRKIKPIDYHISILREDDTWLTVYQEPYLREDGTIVLWHQANGTWSENYTEDYGMKVKGVRLVVNSINRPTAYLGVIEIGAQYRQNLSDEVVSVNVRKQSEQIEVGYPMGTPAASGCSIEFNNTAGRFSPDYGPSDLNTLLDTNARFIVSLGVDTSPQGGAGFEYVRQGMFYADGWSWDNENGTASVECTDFSKFLMEREIPRVLFQDMRVSDIMQDILERVGVQDIVFNRNADEYYPDFVFYNDNATVWDALVDIAKTDQGWFFFNEEEQFVYTTRDKYLEKNGIDLVIDAQTSGTRLANLISVTTEFEVEANKVVVKWSDLSPKKRGNTWLNSILWQHEGAMVLQASVLSKSMDATQEYFVVPQEDARYWPLQGAVNIEGEIIEYDGARVVQGTGANADYKTRRKPGQHPGYRLTGRFVNCKRGARGSAAKAHKVTVVDDAEWQVMTTRGNAAVTGFPDRKRLGQTPDGYMTVALPPKQEIETFCAALRGFSDTTWNQYGASVMFEPKDGRNTHVAGLCYDIDSDGIAGYYVQIATSAQVRKWKGKIAEIKLFRRFADGTIRGLPNNDGFDADSPNAVAGKRGFDKQIIAGKAYVIEVQRDRLLNTHKVYIDGQLVESFTDPYGSIAAPRESGRWGVFVRGGSRAKFDYIYAATLNNLRSIEDDNFIDREEGSYQSRGAMRQRVDAHNNEFVFFEFRPIVHEVRNFKVKFEENVAPALNAELYIHADWQTDVTEFRYNPFGANFTIANAMRRPVIIKGTDTLTRPGNSIEQDFFVYGVNVVRKDERKHVVKDDDKIRRRGPVELELTSPWIQSENQAEDIGKYINTHWGKPTDTVTAEVWGHLALQLGDVVSVNYPFRNMTADKHKYHVTGINFVFKEGLTTNLTLRRKWV